MPASPWRTFGSPGPGADFVALLSYLPLKSYWRLFPFVVYTAQVMKQLAKADGLLGYSLLARPLSKRSLCGRARGRVASLRSAPALHPYHGRSRPPNMDKTKFVRWTVKGSQLPFRWAMCYPDLLINPLVQMHNVLVAALPKTLARETTRRIIRIQALTRIWMA